MPPLMSWRSRPPTLLDFSLLCFNACAKRMTWLPYGGVDWAESPMPRRTLPTPPWMRMPTLRSPGKETQNNPGQRTHANDSPESGEHEQDGTAVGSPPQQQPQQPQQQNQVPQPKPAALSDDQQIAAACASVFDSNLRRVTSRAHCQKSSSRRRSFSAAAASPSNASSLYGRDRCVLTDTSRTQPAASRNAQTSGDVRGRNSVNQSSRVRDERLRDSRATSEIVNRLAAVLRPPGSDVRRAAAAASLASAATEHLQPTSTPPRNLQAPTGTAPSSLPTSDAQLNFRDRRMFLQSLRPNSGEAAIATTAAAAAATATASSQDSGRRGRHRSNLRKFPSSQRNSS